jgi:hypothetical protein
MPGGFGLTYAQRLFSKTNFLVRDEKAVPDYQWQKVETISAAFG